MRRRLLTLIILISMFGVLPNTAYARKITRKHKIKLSYLHSDIHLSTDGVSPDSLLKFAQSLIGVHYRPASSDPLTGFDCSGFVSYVFKNFNFSVPRSSCEFINVGEKVNLADAKPGDIILFTSPKKHRRNIGHVGIVFYNGIEGLRFIHSTSGKEYSVTITAMDETYKRRFVQVVRLLKQND